MHSLPQRNSSAKLVGQGVLHVTEEVARSWQGKQGHGPELAEHLVPLPHTCLLLRDRYGSEDVGEALDSMWGQMYRHVDSVDNPHEHCLDGAP